MLNGSKVAWYKDSATRDRVSEAIEEDKPRGTGIVVGFAPMQHATSTLLILTEEGTLTEQLIDSVLVDVLVVKPEEVLTEVDETNWEELYNAQKDITEGLRAKVESLESVAKVDKPVAKSVPVIKVTVKE